MPHNQSPLEQFQTHIPTRMSMTKSGYNISAWHRSCARLFFPIVSIYSAWLLEQEKCWDELEFTLLCKRNSWCY